MQYYIDVDTGAVLSMYSIGEPDTLQHSYIEIYVCTGLQQTEINRDNKIIFILLKKSEGASQDPVPSNM